MLDPVSGRVSVERSRYSALENVIRMDERVDDTRYCRIFHHEMGHYIDQKMGHVSASSGFRSALGFDRMLYIGPEGEKRITDLLKETAGTRQAYLNGAFSDILSAALYNDTRILEWYHNNQQARYYQHDNPYWDGRKGPSQAAEGEIFANLFMLHTERNDRALGILETYFPSLTKEFERLVKYRSNL